MRRIQRAILRPFTITGWGVMSFAIFFLSLGVSKIFEGLKLVLTGKFTAVYLAQAQLEEEEKNDLHLGPLDLHQQQLFQQTLKDYIDICAKSQTEIGRTNIIKHRIITGDAAPIAQPPYRINPKNRDFLREEIVKMEKNGIIRKSTSPWAAPVVIVDKKGETNAYV